MSNSVGRPSRRKFSVVRLSHPVMRLGGQSSFALGSTAADIYKEGDRLVIVSTNPESPIVNVPWASVTEAHE